MTVVNPKPKIPRVHEIKIRVRYQETDAQGRVHHANFINYFEVARVEMLRAGGISYRELEETGAMLVVAHLECDFLAPANYDDELTVRTTVVRAKGVRIEHFYEIFRDDDLLVTGRTIVASVDRTGKVVRLPDWLRMD